MSKNKYIFTYKLIQKIKALEIQYKILFLIYSTLKIRLNNLLFQLNLTRTFCSSLNKDAFLQQLEFFPHIQTFIGHHLQKNENCLVIYWFQIVSIITNKLKLFQMFKCYKPESSTVLKIVCFLSLGIIDFFLNTSIMVLLKL